MGDQNIAEASGRALLGLISHLKKSHGPDAFKQVLAATDASTQRTFETALVARKWYAYTAYADVLRAAEKTFGTGDGRYARKLGIAAGERDLGSIFKLYAMMASAERLIRSCEKIWPVYYRNAGKMQAIAWEPLRTIVRISDFKHMEPLHCRLMEGWMISTMAQIGCRVSDEGREIACMSKGDDAHDFECTWTPASR
ncbi:MAG: hypothetical protein IT381_02445 [Deltaproteobacteria bacterium]|nr:hypothetical protein [Deltaproteobacteria bacterium]